MGAIFSSEQGGIEMGRQAKLKVQRVLANLEIIRMACPKIGCLPNQFISEALYLIDTVLLEVKKTGSQEIVQQIGFFLDLESKEWTMIVSFFTQNELEEAFSKIVPPEDEHQVIKGALSVEHLLKSWNVLGDRSIRGFVQKRVGILLLDREKDLDDKLAFSMARLFGSSAQATAFVNANRL